MKKLFLTIAISIATLIGIAQPNLYFKINAKVYTTDGREVATGAVVSFTPHDNAISGNKMPCDLNWWVSDASQDSGYAKINVCTDLVKWESTRLDAAYLTVTVPAKEFTYTVFQGWAKAWLESKYGAGKVVILN